MYYYTYDKTMKIITNTTLDSTEDFNPQMEHHPMESSRSLYQEPRIFFIYIIPIHIVLFKPESDIFKPFLIVLPYNY